MVFLVLQRATSLGINSECFESRLKARSVARNFTWQDRATSFGINSECVESGLKARSRCRAPMFLASLPTARQSSCYQSLANTFVVDLYDHQPPPVAIEPACRLDGEVIRQQILQLRCCFCRQPPLGLAGCIRLGRIDIGDAVLLAAPPECIAVHDAIDPMPSRTNGHGRRWRYARPCYDQYPKCLHAEVPFGSMPGRH